ncbi:phosphatase PAP2 family protein [Bacillus sp. MUM 116]|uniref:phosphatase PAP2 family protein n=1 Tax=Bacillus sp. MUM 116 TaxID=1678002 RepID=UPI0008F5EAFE|nr:phosphatase PAP2 family protein [Bacillus sp. MUM 116]OIK10475.1 phosphatase PAP2 family protein [Bacillus sp. MUM 116]
MLDMFYGFECKLFQKVNRHFDKKLLNLFFRSITHLGGAKFTIISTLLLMLLSPRENRLIAISSAIALSASHIPVQIVKLMFPRKRPYLMIEKTKFPDNPLQDHSFPSGHTTAIFAVVIPYILFFPQLALALIPLGVCVGVSRIYLGLHYPSDVFAGGVLGSLTGMISFYILCF